MELTSYQKRIPDLTVPLSGTMRDAASAIARGFLGVCIVVDETTNQFIGLITDGDIRRALLSRKGDTTPISELVNRDAVSVTQDIKGRELAKLFTAAIRVIPILESGIVVDLAVLDSRIHLPVAEPYLTNKEMRYVIDCISSGWISSAGKYVPLFEKAVAEVCGAKYGVSTMNGTSALHLALLACGIGSGDEVIVPALTFIATASAVCNCGATPVFVDVEPDSWCLDPDQLSAAITPSTKAVIPVQLYGHPVRMDVILDIARRHDLWVIEDAAEALGTEFQSKPIGSFGHVAIFSFYGNKTVTTGEGGMVITSDTELAEKMKLLRNHGTENRRYWHTVLGFNYRMTNLQAAVGVGQMENFTEILERKIEIANRYAELLGGTIGITLPSEPRFGKHSYWMYTILINSKELKKTRSYVLDELRGQGIEATPTFIPMNQQPVFSVDCEFPVSDYVAAHGLSLPSFVTLKDSEIKKIVGLLKSILGASTCQII